MTPMEIRWRRRKEILRRRFSEIFIGGMTFDNPGETMVGPLQFEFWLQQRRYSNNGYENSITQLRLQLFYNKCC